MKKNVFEDLFVLDLANNHFGDVKHAKNIIEKFGQISRKYKLKSTIKFQFRELNTFIHKKFKNSDEKFIKRFSSTKMSEKSFKYLFKIIKKNKLLTSCTPFDEASVDLIEKMKFDFIKIASVSSLDFNLLERVTKNNIPKIISTGGKNLSEIDKIVSFLKKKKQTFALMHCIAIYPSSNEQLQIKFIKELISRYKDVTIGWSTHEKPNEFLPASLAYACGARMFEKHIGINSKKYVLNDYSITPDVFENWYKFLDESKKILGSGNKILEKSETITLSKLSRGVYAKRDILKNETLNSRNVYFAFPLQKNQLNTTEIKKNTKILKKIRKDEPIIKKAVIFDKDLLIEYKIRSYIHELKAILNKNNITIQDNFDMEISHHNGLEKFRKTGCFLFNIINKKYAKKMLVLLPNQSHPLHFHKKKDESFHIISGFLVSKLNGKIQKLKPGQILHIRKNSWHEFKAGKDGCIFDEISTTSFKNDSFYKDKNIKKMSRDNRKTYINKWF